MKLVTFNELCEMEDGTVFQSYTPHFLGPLMIFGGALPENRPKGEWAKDFVQAPLLPSADFGELFTNDPQTLPDGSQTKREGFYISTPSGFSRWGLHDYSSRYLVWEREDRERLAQWLLFPPVALRQMNDDSQAIIEVQP